MREDEILANLAYNWDILVLHDIFQSGFFIEGVHDEFPSIDRAVRVVYVPVHRVGQNKQRIARSQVQFVLVVVESSQIHANTGSVFLEKFGHGGTASKLNVLVSNQALTSRPCRSSSCDEDPRTLCISRFRLPEQAGRYSLSRPRGWPSLCFYF
jgi:hypothetical protein